jgi:ABC-type uncharacterized transport system fused permease/ATPase subunit
VGGGRTARGAGEAGRAAAANGPAETPAAARGADRFVPRQPYAASGRLRDILCDGLDEQNPDDRLREVLGEVGLEASVDRQGGLDAERDWSAALSAGELQALTFARLLLASPQFVFLEDPAGTLEAPIAERLYQALAHSSITYFSAGCSPLLLPYHDLQVELHEDGSWQVKSGGQARSDTRTSPDSIASV